MVYHNVPNPHIRPKPPDRIRPVVSFPCPWVDTGPMEIEVWKVRSPGPKPVYRNRPEKTAITARINRN